MTDYDDVSPAQLAAHVETRRRPAEQDELMEQQEILGRDDGVRGEDSADSCD
jgi:hypothetical protein